MVVLENRIDQRLKRRRQGRHVVVRSLAVAPAVVASAAARRLVVDFLPAVLTDVRDDERAGAAARRIVESVAPRVPQPEAPNLTTRGNGLTADERIVRRHLIARWIAVGHVHVDAQHLAEQLGGTLCAVRGIVARTAVAEADVQKTVGTEHEIAAVVVRERLRDERRARGAAPAQIEAGARIGDEWIGRSPEPRDHRVAGRIREVDEEAAARRIIGREDEAQQALFAARHNRRGEVQKIGR